MTYRDVYIGRFTDTSSNTEQCDSGIVELPECLGPYFPPAVDKEPFSELRDRILAGRMLGRKIDWGAWAAFVTKREVQAFVLEMYGNEYNLKDMPHLRERYKHLTDAIAAMAGDKSYVLVALES